MKIAYKAWATALLVAVGVFAVALHTKAACNAANGKEVIVTLSGPEYVAVGSTNLYSLDMVYKDGSEVSTTDLAGGLYNWSATGFVYIDEPADGSIRFEAPQTASSTVNDKRTIECEFLQTDWSSASDCSDSIGVTVLLVSLSAPTADANFSMGMSPPSMPNVPLSASVSPSLPNLQYRFEVGNLAQGGHALVYADAPLQGYTHPAKIDSGWGGSSTNVNFGTDLYGGQCTNITVSLKTGGQVILTKSFDRDFYIVGDSLSTTDREAYINGLTTYSSSIRALARVISFKESGGTQFWPGSGVGTASHTRYPLREGNGGGGYGVMQLTASGLLNISTIWNWQRNIDSGMSEIVARHTAAETYLNTHPSGVTPEMIRREVYHRYNGGPSSFHYWWDASTSQWATYQYVDCPSGAGHADDTPPHGSTHGYRDYNNDGIKDPDGNPYGLPGVSGANTCEARASTYVQQCIDLE